VRDQASKQASKDEGQANVYFKRREKLYKKLGTIGIPKMLAGDNAKVGDKNVMYHTK
jgi:hypothetical protein